MAVLQEYFGLGTLPATQMLFAGCDAGAQGVMYNLDYLNTMLPVDGSGVSGVRTFAPCIPAIPPGFPSVIPSVFLGFLWHRSPHANCPLQRSLSSFN